MNSKFTDQFKPNEAWLVFSIDVLVENEPMHIYSMMDVASTYVFGSILASEGELPDGVEVFELMKNAFSIKNKWPKILFFSEQDSAEKIFRKYADENGITFELASLTKFKNIIDPFEELFRQQFN